MPSPVRYVGYTFQGRRIYIEATPGEPGQDAATIQAFQEVLNDRRGDDRAGRSHDGEDLVPVYDSRFSLDKG